MTIELFSQDVWDEIFDGEDLARAKTEYTESIVAELVWTACADEFERGIYGDPRQLGSLAGR